MSLVASLSQLLVVFTYIPYGQFILSDIRSFYFYLCVQQQEYKTLLFNLHIVTVALLYVWLSVWISFLIVGSYNLYNNIKPILIIQDTRLRQKNWVFNSENIDNFPIAMLASVPFHYKYIWYVNELKNYEQFIQICASKVI